MVTAVRWFVVRTTPSSGHPAVFSSIGHYRPALEVFTLAELVYTPRTYTVAQTARLLGISEQSAYRAAKRGELPGQFAIGRRVLVSRAVLDRLLAEGQGVSNGRQPGEPNTKPTAA